MRRWLTCCATFWLILLVPSLIGWGLVVRWNGRGPDRFARSVAWFSDHLGFPLVLRPLTNPAGRWLTTESGFQAAAGFVLLLAVWCLIFALPLSLVVVWAEWFGRRLDPARGLATAPVGAGALPPGGIAAPAKNALYLVTVPLALGWHALRIGFGPALIAFVAVWTVRFGYLLATALNGPSADFTRQVAGVDQARAQRFHHLWLDHLFHDQWATSAKATHHFVRQLTKNPQLFWDFTEHPTHYRSILTFFAFDAALYALVAALMVGVLAVAIRTVRVLTGP